MKNAKVIISIVVLCLLSGLAYAQISEGTCAPDFTCKTINGNDFTLSTSTKDKVVVLYFFATWCPPCKAEVPYMVELNRWTKNKNAVVIGVSLDDELQVIKSFVKNNKIKHTILHDKRGASAADKYKVESIPTLFVIDKKGVINSVHSGFTYEKAQQKKILHELMGSIKKLL